MNNLEDIIPNDNDVLLGRGNFANAHPGNKQFRAYVEIQRPDYDASQKCDKPIFAKLIITTINNLVPPGRFLTQDSDTDEWIVVDDRKAYNKTRQALREKSSKIAAERTQPKNTIPHSMASATMAASTLTRLQSILAQQLEMAALHRAREFPVYGILQHPFVPNQCNSALYIPPAPSSTVSPSSVAYTDQPEEANPLSFQSPTEQPTQMSSRWMTESWTQQDFALGDTNKYGINDVKHDNLLNADNIKQANVNDDVMTVRKSFTNNISLTDADQLGANDRNHANLFRADDVNQDNVNDDARMVIESFVNNETFIPEHSKAAANDVNASPKRQSLIDASRALKSPAAVEKNHISDLTDLKNLSLISSLSDLRLTPLNSRALMGMEDNPISTLNDMKHLQTISGMSDLRPTCCNPLSPMAMEENHISNLTDMKDQSYTLSLSDQQVIIPQASFLTMPFNDEESLAPEKSMELIKQSSFSASFSSMIDELINPPHIRRHSPTANPSNHLSNLSHLSGIRSMCESISCSDSIFSMSEALLTHWVSEVSKWEEEEDMKEDHIMQE